MNEFLKNFFRKPTALELAATELAEAERKKLEAETAREYADSVVQYRNAQINRLRHYLSQAE